MIDYAAVYFFGYAIVKTPVSRLHMKDRYASPCRSYSGKSAVGIAQDQNSIRHFTCQDVVDLGYDLTGLFTEGRGTNTEVNIRRTHLEIAEKDVAKALCKVLSGMDSNVIAMLVKDLHHDGQSDDLRTGAENSQYFHIERSVRSESVDL